MIVTLAGHVDHGKTSLVRALTGIDTDRLAEEKRRGLTIDLGFAYADIDGHRVGFVDVPGHHRFIHNMVAGVASRQTALVVVAADDGIMPQTREHVTILDLIGISRAVIAISKCDRAEDSRCARVESDVRALLSTTGLVPAAVVHSSIVANRGIAELRSAIAATAHTEASAPENGEFRLAVDRAFTVRGIGLIATGIVHAGSVAEGDSVVLAPSGRGARIRSIHAQDRPASRARPGDRCALHLSGIELGDIRRGDWLVAEGALAPTRSISIALTVASDFARRVKHGLPVHVYHATSHAEGRVALLDSGPVAPGQHARVDLVLDSPLNPKHGDRLILRDHGLDATLGGGEVLEITPVRRGRRSALRLARLEANAARTPQAALDALLAIGEVDLKQFRDNWNLRQDELDPLIAATDTVRIEAGGHSVLEDARRWRDQTEAIVQQIGAAHAAEPTLAGIRRDRLTRGDGMSSRRLDALIQSLLTERRIEENAGLLRLPGHHARLPEADERWLTRIETRLRVDGQPPSVGDLAKEFRADLTTLRRFVQRMHGMGRLVRVSDARIFLPEQIRRFIGIVHALAAEKPDGFSARDFRDASGIGRNLVIEVLEYFDAKGFTRRYGDVRRIVGAEPI